MISRSKKYRKGLKTDEISLMNLCIMLGVDKKQTRNIIKEYNQHLNPLSLQAISDSLSRNGIRNKAVKIGVERIKDLPKASLLYFENQNQFALLEKINEENVYLIHPQNGNIVLSFNELLNEWNGIVLISSFNDKLKVMNKEDSTTNKQPIFILGIISILLLLILRFYNASVSFIVSELVLIFLNILGLFLSANLIKFEILGIHEGLGRYCYLGKTFNCLEVSNSNFSRILKYFTLSEMGFVFFSFINFIFFFSSFYYLKIHENLFVLFLLTIPMILGSVFYQAFIIKKWCIFCLLIDTILIIQLILFYPFNEVEYNLSLIEIIIISFSIIFSFLLLFVYKYFLGKKVIFDIIESNLRFFFQSSDIIESKFNKEELIDIKKDSLDIILGEIDSINYILFVLNPFCEKCQSYFNEILILLNKGLNIQIIIRFIPLKDSSNESEVLKILYAKYKSKGASYVLDSISEFYSQKKLFSKKIRTFIQKNRVLLKDEDVEEKININKKWFNTNNIKSLPTVLINGKVFPKIFPPESIYHFLIKSDSFKNK